jgi:hypothetical protein
VHTRVVSLLVSANFLATRGICRPLHYTPQTPRVEDLNGTTIARQEKRRDRLPTDAALSGLASIYGELAVALGSVNASGGELEQIQFLLGHVSVQTTERYLGCKQRIRSAVNGRIGIEPNL